MSKVWVLKYGYCQYDQLDGYTVAIWKDKPDFHQIKKWFEQEDDGTSESKSYALDFNKYNTTKDAVYGMLARGETVLEQDNGGDTLVIEVEELL